MITYRYSNLLYLNINFIIYFQSQQINIFIKRGSHSIKLTVM